MKLLILGNDTCGNRDSAILRGLLDAIHLNHTPKWT